MASNSTGLRLPSLVSGLWYVINTSLNEVNKLADLHTSLSGTFAADHALNQNLHQSPSLSIDLVIWHIQ